MSKQPHDYLVSTCFDFNGRSISVTVEHDGFSYWLDESSARRLNQKEQNSTKFLSGDEQAGRRWSRIYEEHTIQVAMPEDSLKVIREELSVRYWADTCDKDFDLEKRLDAILEPLFWEYVNQYLSPPCTRATN
jgi:hypothetical protein